MDEAIRRTRRGITVKLEMTQKQELKLTPQMLQSMEILQMSTQELEAYLQELVQENPAAELSEPEERPDEGEELWRRMQSLADQDNQNRQYVAAEREELDPLARIGTDGGLEDTLLLHLSRQLERSQAPTLVLRGAQFLAACLDEAGYLREKVENLAQAAGLPAAVLEEGLSLLQTLDPAGVGARDLSQCLELQLRRRGEEGTALAIVQRGLERLARRQYRALAQELGVSRQEVLRAEAQIRALDPRPGAAFAPREEPVYLVPDLVVLQGERGLEVHLQESRLPGLRLSRFYCDMYRDDPDPEVRQYLDGKIRQAQWAIQAVEQRRATLLRCAQVLVRRQEAFFQGPGGSLTSLRLADVAAELSIHESTVSRAVREKYLQCARGVYPLSFFFPREVGAGEGQSAHAPADPGGGQEPPLLRPEAVSAAGGGGIRRLPPHCGQIPGGAGGLERRWAQSVNGSSSVGSCRIRLQNIGNGKKYSGFPCKDWMDMVHLYGTQPHGAVSLLLGERKAFVGWQTDQIK